MRIINFSAEEIYAEYADKKNKKINSRTARFLDEYCLYSVFLVRMLKGTLNTIRFKRFYCTRAKDIFPVMNYEKWSNVLYKLPVSDKMKVELAENALFTYGALANAMNSGATFNRRDTKESTLCINYAFAIETVFRAILHSKGSFFIILK